MTEDDVQALHKRVRQMSEDERKSLDPVCEALQALMQKDIERRGGYCGPNRVIALACLDLAWQWSDVMMSQE